MCLRFHYDVAVTVMSNLACWLVLGAFGRLQIWFASRTGAEAEAEDGGTPVAALPSAFRGSLQYKVGKGKVKAIEPGTGQKSLRSRNVYETPFHRNIAMLLRGPR